jgi:gliding motility-associated-like protein
MSKIINRSTIKKIVLGIVFLLSFVSSDLNAQTCSSTSKKSWEWPGHNNWYLPTGSTGNTLNQTTGVVSGASGSGYQGVTCASDDKGKLLFYCNGISAWRADGSLITNQIWSGVECGFQSPGTSAVHGNMTVRHPLTPNKYYIITIDDIVNQGFGNGTGGNHSNNCSPPAGMSTASHGISYAVIDSSANLVHSSKPIESNITTNLQGQLRTTEDMAATFHANGVDIWITFHPLWSEHVVSYLLTCDGFVTAPVVSGEGIVNFIDIFEGVGGLDFTQDGSKLAVGAEAVTSDGRAFGTISLYDFDNATGIISNRLRVYNNEWSSGNVYSLFFGPNGKWLHFNGSAKGKVDISSNNAATIRGTYATSAELTTGNTFNAGAITRSGQLLPSDKVYAAAGLTPRFSSNNMFIPPLEEPDIEEVEKLCNDDDPVDLNTNWICSGLDAEDGNHSYFALDSNDVTGATHHPNTSSIIDEKTGVFNPAAADIGFNKIVFVYCGVNDTIEIEVEKCSKCTATLRQDPYPVFCAGNEIRLDTFIIVATGARTWEIDSVPSNSGLSDAVVNVGAGPNDTLFSALPSLTRWGTYRLKLTASFDEGGGSILTCSDTMYVTVDSLPIPILADSTVCANWDSVTFDPGVYDSYVWGPDGETTQTITKLESETYTVTVTDGNGCQGDTLAVLIINELPTADLGDDVEICAIEDSVLFNAGHSTAQSWVWDHGRTTQTIKAKNEGTETYRVVVTDENGCIGEDKVDLTVSPMPEVTIRDSSVCIDADDVLFDVGADFDQYLWSNGDATRTSTISAAGDYSVTFTALEGCGGTADFKLERTALPTPDLGADQIICADVSALDFTPGVFASYLWNDGKTTPTLSTKVAGDYEVEVTDDKGCKASDDVKLTVIDMPTPDIIKDETKCPGSPHTFDVVGYDNGNGPYTYAWDDGSTASTFPTSIATTVWVDITDQYGCTGRDLGSVIDKSDLTVNILDNLTVNLCEGEDVTLIPNFKASDGYFFTWSTDGSGTSETLLATATGTYDLHVDNGGGCEGDGTIDVIVHLDPVLLPDAAGICDGEAALIGGMNNLGGTYTYLWSTGETSATISVLTAGIYTQEVTSNQGCVSEETVDVDVYANPTPNIQGTTVCQGVPVTLTDLNDKGETDVFSWSTGATTATISPTTTGSFTLDVIDIHGCEGTSTTAVTFIAYPTVDLGKDMVICEGDDKVTFDAGNIGNTITWNSGQTTSTINTDQAGEYIVTVSDGGCPAYDTVLLSVVDLPVSELNQLLGVAPYCFNELETAILLEAGARNDYEYLWGTGETTSAISVDAAGTYTVEISAGTCSITDRIKLSDYCPSTLYVPNTFTPDGDGINDSFNAIGSYISDYQMFIYNRWGQLIYKTESMTDDWDGTFMGQGVQVDTYVYKIYYKTNHPDGYPVNEQKVGIVNLLR